MCGHERWVVAVSKKKLSELPVLTAYEFFNTLNLRLIRNPFGKSSDGTSVFQTGILPVNILLSGILPLKLSYPASCHYQTSMSSLTCFNCIFWEN